MIVVPILLILLFFILLTIGVGFAIPCIRLCVSSHRKRKSQEVKVVASLDTLERTSVYNIYPPNPVSGNVNNDSTKHDIIWTKLLRVFTKAYKN